MKRVPTKPPMTVPTPAIPVRPGVVTDILNQPDKPWRPGDPVNLSNNQIWQVVAQKLAMEKQQLEATATELDLKVTLYKSAYEQASALIGDLRNEIESLKCEVLLTTEKPAQAKVTPIQRKKAEPDAPQA